MAKMSCDMFFVFGREIESEGFKPYVPSQDIFAFLLLVEIF